LTALFPTLHTSYILPLDENSDYNGGFVLPFALPFKTVVVGSLSSEVEFKVVSCSMGKEVA
jgi:galactokinase